MRITLIAYSVLLLISCKPKIKADLILTQGVIYTADSAFSVVTAMAVRDGSILATGSDREMLEAFESEHILPLAGKPVFPGFYDAHCHFYAYGKGLFEADLTGTNSFDDALSRTLGFLKQNSVFPEAIQKNGLDFWITARGWDQNDWEKREFPDRRTIDSLFPDVPVLLTRVDGHAALANGAALKIAGFTPSTRIEGGALEQKNGRLTGILIDNAVDSIRKLIPEPRRDDMARFLLKAQEHCLAMGITSVADAGLKKNVVDLIDSLHKSAALQIRVYAMLAPDAVNLQHYLKKGPYITEKLTVRSFKFYADGALGSRGACMLEDYSDMPGWKGFLLKQPSYFEEQAALMAKSGFQMNMHCIGDSSLRMALKIYNKYKGGKDLRWRIEHAQVIHEKDLPMFEKVIPSVQPTHATSDMYWAETRLGKERMRSAYAYRDLLRVAGSIALGTDFPVEGISPFRTFYAAVCRKDDKGFPPEGFQRPNALNRQETLRGMTIWAAYAAFEEKQKGSLEKNKVADFIVLDTDIMRCGERDILSASVISTYISGKEVFKR